MFFTAKDGEGIYGQQKQDLEMTVAQRVKRLPAMKETWVRFLGWEDPLEKETATHFSTLAKSHGRRSLVGYMESQRVRHD